MTLGQLIIKSNLTANRVYVLINRLCVRPNHQLEYTEQDLKRIVDENKTNEFNMIPDRIEKVNTKNKVVKKSKKILEKKYA